jgi:hypothetical protein
MPHDTPGAFIDVNRPTLPLMEQREWRHVPWQVEEYIHVNS